jgi:hypothetical protein
MGVYFSRILVALLKGTLRESTRQIIDGLLGGGGGED